MLKTATGCIDFCASRTKVTLVMLVVFRARSMPFRLLLRLCRSSWLRRRGCCGLRRSRGCTARLDFPDDRAFQPEGLALQIRRTSGACDRIDGYRIVRRGFEGEDRKSVV